MPVARSVARPGRSCPRSYFYGPQALAGETHLRVDSLWVTGGLYGNPFALDALLEAYDRESGAKALVFNGDFHWFDIDPPEFERIDAAVLGFHALRGNVETELAAPAPPACRCCNRSPATVCSSTAAPPACRTFAASCSVWRRASRYRRAPKRSTGCDAASCSSRQCRCAMTPKPGSAVFCGSGLRDRTRTFRTTGA